MVKVGRKTRSRKGGEERGYKVAILGNPNVGKSTLFTSLTSEVAHIANWPGTTIERKEGVLRFDSWKLVFVDLPGVYSLAGTSVEEKVARDFILEGDWDAILVLVDSLAPERTLYLALHALEITGKVVIALTKWDAAHSSGVHVNVEELKRVLGARVVPVSAVTGEGLDELTRALLEVVREEGTKPLTVDYGQLEPAVAELEHGLKGINMRLRAPLRWIALRLLEGDGYVAEVVRRAGGEEVLGKAGELREAITKSTGVDPGEVIVSQRYRYVDSISKRAVLRREVGREAGRLERFLLSPVWGPPFSLAILLSLYLAVFALNTGFPLNLILEFAGFHEAAEALESYTLSGLVSSFFGLLAGHVEASGIPEPLASFLAEGLIPGLSLVVSFLPLILTALIALSFLEDSGIGPYAAASLHKFFQRLGLSGRAVYPVLISIGCNVPAIMASRTAPDEVERKQLMVSVPFVPCQARLLVLLAFASAYFSRDPLLATLAVALSYVAAFALLGATSLLARRALGSYGAPELILELPRPHMPSLKVVWWIAWDYAEHYVKRAGLIIFGLSALLWCLTRLGPGGLAASPGESYAASLGRCLAPLAGVFGLYGSRAEIVAFAALAGLVAKETAVLSIAVYTGSADPIEALSKLELTPPQALALMVFFSTYMPCLAAIATIARESDSLEMTLTSVIWSILASLSASYAVYALASMFFT